MPHPVFESLSNMLAGASSAKSQQNPVLAQERGRSVAALNKARKLALQHGINIDKDAEGGWWVTCSKFADGKDPMEGNQFACDGREVLDTVQAYALEIEKLAA